MNYASIRKCDIANGEGVRVSLFVSGCTHHCKGCFNAEAQAFDYGKPFTREVEEELLEALKPDYIAGLTILGGEPMEVANQRALLPFLRRFHAYRVGLASGSVGLASDSVGLASGMPTLNDAKRPYKTLWIYTGCVYERLKGDGGTTSLQPQESPPSPAPSTSPYPWRCEATDEILAMTDVLVDGPFVEELKDISLKFRGSSNQRILELWKTGSI